MMGNPDHPVGGLAVPRPAGVEIRPLGREDFADAIALARELYTLDVDADLEPLRPAYDALVNDPDATPFLAVADGVPAGLIVQRLRRRLNHATFEGWISDLVVREPFRGRGIGRALLASTIAEWRLRGGHQMMLEVSYDRTVARALYEAAGFENQGKYFEIGPVRTRGIEPAAGVEIRPIAEDDADFDATTRLLAELGRPAPAEEKLPALRRTYDQHVRRADTASMLAALDGKLEGGMPIVSVTIGAYAAESDVADILRQTEAAHPGVTIGSYPFMREGIYGATFVIRSQSAELADRTATDLARRLLEVGIEPVAGEI